MRLPQGLPEFLLDFLDFRVKLLAVGGGCGTGDEYEWLLL